MGSSFMSCLISAPPPHACYTSVVMSSFYAIIYVAQLRLAVPWGGQVPDSAQGKGEVNEHWIRDAGYTRFASSSVSWPSWGDEQHSRGRQFYFPLGYTGCICSASLAARLGKVGGHDNVTSGFGHKTPIRTSSLSLFSFHSNRGGHTLKRQSHEKEPRSLGPWITTVEQSHLPCPAISNWTVKEGEIRFCVKLLRLRGHLLQ